MHVSTTLKHFSYLASVYKRLIIIIIIIIIIISISIVVVVYSSKPSKGAKFGSIRIQ